MTATSIRLCFLAITLSCLNTTNTVAGWRAGSARCVITPQEPTWMSGYAGRNKPADGTLHDLWCKAIVLQDDRGRKAVLVTLDLVGIGRGFSQRVCNRIAKKLNVQRAQICLSTSHTHTGPVVAGNLNAMYFLSPKHERQIVDYGEWLENKIVETVDQAAANLFDAVVASGIGACDFAVNRRNNREPDVSTLREQNKLVGPTDHEVPVITVRDKTDDRLRVIVFGYACHATTLSFYKWSGDWPGFGQLELEERYPETTAMFFAGCGADQNPLPRRTVELAKRYGRKISEAVAKVIDENSTANLAARFEARYREISLPFAFPKAREELTELTQHTNKYDASRARVLLQQLNATGEVVENYPYPVQVWRLGENLIVTGLGGEVVVDFSIRLKSVARNETLFVGAYMNDVMAYIPSERVLREGGYEGARAMVYYGLPSPWKAGVEDRICKTVEQLILETRSNNAK